MDIWMVLAGLLWVLVIGSHFFKEKGTGFFFALFDGLLMAYLCFWMMPEAFEEGRFWIGAVGSLAGVFIGAALEQKAGKAVLQSFWNHIVHSIVFTGAVIFCNIESYVLQNPYILSACASTVGGFFLFVACSGILPENCSTMQKLVKGCGGMAGFIVGVLLLCRF